MFNDFIKKQLMLHKIYMFKAWNLVILVIILQECFIFNWV